MLKFQREDRTILRDGEIRVKLDSDLRTNLVMHCLTDSYEDGRVDGWQDAIGYGDAYLSIVAEDCGMSMAKFMGILCKHGVSLAKK